MTPIKTPFGGTLEFYPLPDTSGKGTVLICPGGGYSFLAEREGRPIADAFNQNGYSAAILNYCFPLQAGNVAGRLEPGGE